MFLIFIKNIIDE